MKTWMNVPCPQCGGNLDVPMHIVERRMVPWSTGQRVYVQFEPQYVVHECNQ